MLQLFYLVFTITLILTYVGVFLHMRNFLPKPSPIFGWFLGLFFFIILPMSIIIFYGGVSLQFGFSHIKYGAVDLRDQTFFTPFLISWFSLVLSAVVVFFTLRRQDRIMQDKPDALSDRNLININIAAMLIVFGKYVFTVVAEGNIKTFFNTYWYSRGDIALEKYGYAFVLLQYIEMASVLIMVTATALLITRFLLGHEKSIGRLIYCVFPVLFLGIVMLFSGNRYHFAVLGLFILSSLFLYRLKKYLVVSILFIPIAALFFSVWVSYRGGEVFDTERARNLHSLRTQMEGSLTRITLMDMTEATNIMLLYHVLDDFGKKYPFQYGKSYIKPLLKFFPGKKTEHLSVQLAKYYLPGEDTSLNVTALGEMYINFGVFCIFFLPLLTYGIVVLTNKLETSNVQRTWMASVLFTIFLISARFPFSTMSIIAGFMLFGSLCVQWGGKKLLGR